MLFISWEVIQPKNTVQPTFSHFWPRHLVLTNVCKRPDNFEFSEKCFRSRGGGGNILQIMKAQANGIICSGMTGKYL
jgi:hypothetical protein